MLEGKFVLTMMLSIAGALNAAPVLSIVKLVDETKREVAPAWNVKPDSQLAVEVLSLGSNQPILLRASLLIDMDGDGLYAPSEDLEAQRLDADALAKQNLSTNGQRLLVRLEAFDRRNAAALTVRMTFTENGATNYLMSRLTLDLPRALRSGPAALAEANSNLGFWTRLTRIYDRVRDDPRPNPRSIFVVDLSTNGPAKPIVHSQFRSAPVHGLCVSPAGERLACVRLQAGEYELWSSELDGNATSQRCWRSSQRISFPHFLDKNRVVFIHDGKLKLSSIAADSTPEVLAAPLYSMEELYSVRGEPMRADYIVSGRQTAMDEPSPYLLKAADHRISLYLLPEHRYYPLYDRMSEGVPVLFARSEEDQAGIYYLDHRNPEPQLLCKCKYAGLIAIASNGSKAAFASGPLESQP